MRIEAVTLREIQMPLVHFFETSFNRIYSRRILLVALHCDGMTVWGECVAGEDPFYSEESIETAWYVIREYLAPALMSAPINNARECGARFERVRAHRMAKAALENALWEAEAQQKGIPLWKHVGGSRMEVPCGVSIGIQDSVEQLLEKIETELAAGYQRIKVKIKPGWDISVVERIRTRWPNILLSCDANSAYRLEDLEHLKKLDAFNLLMIEQPLWNDDVFFHAQLQKQLKTAICLDESIVSSRSAGIAVELKACRIMNIKVGRIGGFSEAIAVHNICQSAGIPVWCGGMLEAGIGRAQNIALSSLPNFTLPGDVSASRRYWKEDIVEPEITVSASGTITQRNFPGSGYKVREDFIEELTVRKEEMRAHAASVVPA